MHVVTEVDPETGALLARNPFRADFAGAVAFADVSLRPRTVTADRAEFLGRHGSLAAPAALGRVELSAAPAPALDPCAAHPGPVRRSARRRRRRSSSCSARPRTSRRPARWSAATASPAAASRRLAGGRRRWDRILDAVQVRTPDPAIDLLAEPLAAVPGARAAGSGPGRRSTSRAGPTASATSSRTSWPWSMRAPAEARAQILRAASRQFLEGDVQHWWHPPTGRGVRTRISDDFLWLPLRRRPLRRRRPATRRSSTSGSRSSKRPPLTPGQEDDYGLPGGLGARPARSTSTASGPWTTPLRLGPHGLPLMGTGDWNDGMNRVGAEGKGESVWLAWFLIDHPAPVRRAGRGPGRRRRARPAYRDAGRGAPRGRRGARLGRRLVSPRLLRRRHPAGLGQNDECQIDSIAQSWAVISGAADPERGRRAMERSRSGSCDRDDGLILLLDPAVRHGPLRARLHQGLRPGHPRERRPVHARGGLGGAGRRALGQGRRGAHEPVRPAQPDPPRRWTRRRSPATRSSPTSWPATSTAGRPHVGRGGWTWYTGSAALALPRRPGDDPRLPHDAATAWPSNPCIPPDWPGFEITYRYGSTIYRIVVENPAHRERGVAEVWLDGEGRDAPRISLVDDRQAHEVRIVIGSS